MASKGDSNKVEGVEVKSSCSPFSCSYHYENIPDDEVGYRVLERIDIIGQNGPTGEHYEETIMDNKLYQQFTDTTAIESTRNLPYLISGLCSEAGEVAGKYKKHVRDLTPRDLFHTDLKKELGDVLWYVSQLCNLCGLTLDQVMIYNRDKLTDRKNRDVISGSGDAR